MNLSVEIKLDFHGSISIIDYTRDFDEYISEEVSEILPTYYNFKYSDTYTIDILEYISSKGDELLNVYFSSHETESDSIRVPVHKDGYYIVHHIVLPTLDWLEKVKDLDLTLYTLIYVTDGKQIYKYFNGNLYSINPHEVTEANTYKTTISIASFKIFSLDKLKRCYTLISRNIMNNYINKCNTIDPQWKFNRDFLLMTINVITYYLEWEQYSEALLVLEDIGCHNFCGEVEPKKFGIGCGCKK